MQLNNNSLEGIVHEIKSVEDITKQKKVHHSPDLSKYRWMGFGAGVVGCVIYLKDYLPKMAAYNDNVPWQEWVKSTELSIIPVLIWGFGSILHVYYKHRREQAKQSC